MEWSLAHAIGLIGRRFESRYEPEVSRGLHRLYLYLAYRLGYSSINVTGFETVSI